MRNGPFLIDRPNSLNPLELRKTAAATCYFCQLCRRLAWFFNLFTAIREQPGKAKETAMTSDEKTGSDPSEVLNLDPLHITALIRPVQTPGADGGLNYNIIHSTEDGLVVQLLHYLNMQASDWIQVFWGGDDTPVATGIVLPEQVGAHFPLYVPANRIPEGVHDLYATVTRSGGGNGGSTLPLSVLVRTVFPGGTDPAPDEDGHQNLLAPQPELPPSGIIDEEAAKNGVKVTITGYPNMRVFDRITFSWGGELLFHEVTQAEVDAGSLDILVDEATILAAGADENLILVYRVRDEVHNISSDWSIRTTITVEVGEDLFDAPWIENPDPAADPYEVIRLDDLGDDDLIVQVMVFNNGLLVGDEISLTWTGTTAQGMPITFTPEPQTVTRPNQAMPFIIPNGDVRVLGGGRGVASYTVTRDGAPAGHSKRAFASFIGAEQKLPKPIVKDADNGMLDPGLAQTTVTITGDVLEAGDIAYLAWLGTRANGSTLLHEESRNVSGGTAGQPMVFDIPREAIAPLEGGTVQVYYQLYKRSIDMRLESDREHLKVGESQSELPAPSTNPPPEYGVLDPDKLPAGLKIIVPHWPGMNDRQTVHLAWRSSGGSHDDFMPISAPMVGQDVEFHMSREQVEAYRDETIQLSYWIETPGEVSQVSETLRFMVGEQQEIGTGPLRIMGARTRLTNSRVTKAPNILTALHDINQTPLIVAWRYEDSDSWSAASEWLDEKPWLKLYVRSASETWECHPFNIAGNGVVVNGINGAAFTAMRNEVADGEDVIVDLVAWGDPAFGGKLEDAQIALENVVEISSNGHAFAARLRNGDVACWGDPEAGGTPPLLSGEFIQIRGGLTAFVARKKDGELVAWGSGHVVPVPAEVLLHEDYVDVYCALHACAALRRTGHVVAWGDPLRGGELRQGQERYDDIVQIMGNMGGFIALRDLGNGNSVIGWGHSDYGGQVPEGIAVLTNVKQLAATAGGTFCILLETGEVKAWPLEQIGGDIPQEVARLTDIVEVTATTLAYCARRSNGKVVAWGHHSAGGDLPDYVADRSDIVQVVGNLSAFAALCRDGSVLAWGMHYCGGDTSMVVDRLTDVRAIYTAGCAFAALTADGRVVTWGTPAGGGDSDAVQPELTGHVTTGRLLSADEAKAVMQSPRD